MGRKLFELSEEPCPRCLALAREGRIRVETVQRLPVGALAPLAHDRSGKCCFDCASADALMAFMGGTWKRPLDTTRQPMTFEMARIAVGNDRQEQYRLPGAPLGLVNLGLVRSSKPGELEDQHAWLDRQNWFDIDTEDGP